MSDVDVRGLGELEDLGRALKAAGSEAKGFRRELFRGLNSVTKEARRDLKEAVPDALPKRGGLAATFGSSARFTTSTKASGPFLGVTIWGKARGHDMRTLTGKRLRHPVYGNRRVWVTQTKGVNPEVLLAKWHEQDPEVRQAVLGVISAVRSKIYRRV